MNDSHQPERVYALLVETNPVRDPEQARELIDRRRGRLTLVEPRRYDMTDLKDRTDRNMAPQRPRWMIPAAAAAAVILLVGVFVMLMNGSDTVPDVATTVPPTTTEAPATTAPSTTQAPATTQALIDPELLVGTWRNPRDQVLLRFEADGTVSYSLVGSADVTEFGSYMLEGNRLTMTSEGGTDPNCLESGPGVYDLEISEGVGVDQGQGLQLTGRWVSDSCTERVQVWGWFWTLTE